MLWILTALYKYRVQCIIDQTFQVCSILHWRQLMVTLCICLQHWSLEYTENVQIYRTLHWHTSLTYGKRTVQHSPVWATGILDSPAKWRRMSWFCYRSCSTGVGPTLLTAVTDYSYCFPLQDVSTLTPSSPDVISRQATINIGKCYCPLDELIRFILLT